MEKMAVYLSFGKECGWTPEQVDKMDALMVQDMLTILEEIKKKEMK